MSLNAGARDRRITFLSAALTRDEFGVEQEQFVPAFSAWCYVRYGTGQERREGDAINAVQAATIRAASTASARAVLTRDRVNFDGGEWGIRSIAYVGAQGHEIEFGITRIGRE